MNLQALRESGKATLGQVIMMMMMMMMILKIFIIAVKENMIDIFYFGPLILKTVELCLKKVSACYRDRDLFNMAKMTAKHQKLCDPL